jgi:hypothetical protein
LSDTPAAPQIPATPVPAANAPAEPDATVTPARPRRPRLIALGLILFGILAWGSQGPFGSFLLFVPTAVLLLALIGDTFAFGWFDRVRKAVPQVPWARLHPIAVWGLLIIGLLHAGAFFGCFVFGIGLVLLARQGETTLGPLDLRLLWASWGRRVMLALLLLASLTFSTQWDGDFRSTYYYDQDGYRYQHSTEMAGSDGYDTGAATWLAVLIALGVAALALRPSPARSWYRMAPLAVGLVAATATFRLARADAAFVKEIQGGGSIKYNAEGPSWFLLLMIPFCILAAVSAFRRPRPEEHAGDPLSAT